MTKPDQTVVAAFDFDGTLTKRDTLLPFLLFATGQLGFILRIVRLAPVLLAYAFRLMRNDLAKEKVLAVFLAGHPLERIELLGTEFAARRLPSLLVTEAMTRVAWHKKQGHVCVLVSASLIHYLEHWAKQAGFDHIIASCLETDAQGLITGRLKGGNCYGPEKARRLQTLLGAEGDYTLYAYGDSAGDHQMLAMADHRFYRTIPAETDA